MEADVTLCLIERNETARHTIRVLMNQQASAYGSSSVSDDPESYNHWRGELTPYSQGFYGWYMRTDEAQQQIAIAAASQYLTQSGMAQP